MYKELRFKKEDGVWYIDLPNWIGPKHALSMVAGADKLLDLYNMYSIKKNNIVELCIDTSANWEPKGVGDLHLKKIKSSTFGGATYKTGIKEVPTIWLCPVTLFVLHEYPKEMYINYRWNEFMEPSLYYFTYDNIPGTGPNRDEELKEHYDFNDWQRDFDLSFYVTEEFKEGQSISEIAKSNGISEEEVKNFLYKERI